MKKETKRKLYSTWQSVIHYSFITLFLVLIIVLPVLYTQTGTPPYWAIWLIFGVLLIFYLAYWIILLIYRKRASSTLDNPTTNSHIAIEQDQDEIIRLQHSCTSSSIQSQMDDDVDPAETSYNPSTVGIPPSSFLAPTINQQASIRSSSLDYTPPPPAYQDMIYPPSYRSTNSTKDDNNTVVY